MDFFVGFRNLEVIATINFQWCGNPKRIFINKVIYARDRSAAKRSCRKKSINLRGASDLRQDRRRYIEKS